MDAVRARMLARVTRWLGPWTPDTRRPHAVVRRQLRVQGSEPFDAWLYRPRGAAPTGALLVVPGLHYLGPADPRLDRFMAVLANAGILALCPFLPEFRRLSVGPSLVDDTRAAYDALLEVPELPPGSRPGAFSISFGSYPAIHLARDRDIGALTLFGGYASFEEVIRFSLVGHPEQRHDPLNRPIIFINLIQHMEIAEADREPLRRAWITYVRRTWGKPWMKEGPYLDVAREMARRLSESQREPFLVGTGAAPGGTEVVEKALVTGHPTLLHLDARVACPGVRCPVRIIHGEDDDVIPHTQAQMLADAMPATTNARVHLTGLFSHTGSNALDPRLLRAELSAMKGIVTAIVDGSRR